MKLLDEITAHAVESQEPISVLLRKCLVLAYQLKNDRLKTWIEKELDGYKPNDDVPEYRQVPAGAKGTFLGGGGAAIYDQPLPPGVLKPEHRHWASSIELRQPIAAYDIRVVTGKTSDKGKSRLIIEWPADLTAHYQTQFIKGYALNRAWQEIPESSIISLIDTVRNRVLRFALELKDESGLVSNDLAAVPQEKVNQYVTNFIFGGGNVISGTAHGITQIGNIVVAKDDVAGLAAALKTLGVDNSDLTNLTNALKQDAAEAGHKSFGQRAVAWLKAIAPKLGQGGVKMGADVAKAWILQYLGLS
jgi:hypothetical protein